MKILFRTRIHQPVKVVKEGFTKELFMKLAPHWSSFELLRFDGCKKNDEVHIRISLMGLKQEWISVITEEHESPTEWFFVDQGKKLPWPLKSWKHIHRVDRIGDKDCEIVDDIEFEASSPILGKLIYPFLWSTFAIRPKLYKDFFEV